MTVPDLDEAVAFFVEIAGFRLAKLDVAGMPLELFEYEGPEVGVREPPRPETNRCGPDGGSHQLPSALARSPTVDSAPVASSRRLAISLAYTCSPARIGG